MPQRHGRFQSTAALADNHDCPTVLELAGLIAAAQQVAESLRGVVVDIVPLEIETGNTSPLGTRTCSL